ncbi:hypothetical protein PRJ_5690 (plasmid) [Pseudomonas sp. XWY-1]|nr:hypothetical protein PRJ_5690 [Pseudomonas sp. XWY-1]
MLALCQLPREGTAISKAPDRRTALVRDPDAPLISTLSFH